MSKIIIYPTVEESIEKLKSKVYFIPSMLENEDTFEEFRHYFYDMLKGGFEVKELREYPVRFTFKLGEEPHELQLRRFYVNLLMWYPLVALGKYEDIDETFIVNDYTAKGRERYMNNKIILPYRESIDLVELNIAINDCIYLLSEIARDFNEIMGDSMDMSSFVMLSLKNKKFHDLMNTKIDPNDQPGVVEKILDEKLKELTSILKTTENPLKATLLSGNNIKSKQMIEYFIAVGYKSTVDGKTIPVPISSNFCKGIKTIPEFYVESNSAIKALLANATKMGKSGAWQKQMLSLCSGIRIDHNVKDCNSVKPIKVIVKSQHYLDMLDGRYRIGFRGRRIPITSKDTHLIGKTIMIKSPMTCGCKPGFICETCYGKLNKINGNTGVGALGAVKTTEPISQSVLSTKHINTTDSEVTEFNASTDFNRICELNSNEIYTRKDIDVPLSNFRLILNISDIKKLNAEDEGLDINEYVLQYYIKNIVTGELDEVKESNGKQLFLSPELNGYINEFNDKIIKDGQYVINLESALEYVIGSPTPETKKIDNEEDDELPEDELVNNEGALRLFITEIQNNELTQPFYDLMNIFSYFVQRDEPTVEWMYQRVFDLMINAHLFQPAVFFEIMIKSLMRKATDILDFPDFNTLDGANDYQISVIKTALSKHPSALVGLSSTNVDEQLKRVATFDKRATGFVDEFYRA